MCVVRRELEIPRPIRTGLGRLSCECNLESGVLISCALGNEKLFTESELAEWG